MSREMKDSGVEWIGEIPENWYVNKLKYNFYRSKKVGKNVENILTLARSGIKVRDISNGEGQIAADYSKYNEVKPMDILLNPMDLQSGDNCNISKVSGIISPAYFNLRPIKELNLFYFNYYFKMQYWLGAFFTHGKGVSFDNRWTLNDDTLKKYPLLIPKLDEQNKIVDFLDYKLNKIQIIVEKTQSSIKELKKYKQSLITEVVTKGLDKNVEMKDSGIEWIGDIPKDWGITKLKYQTLVDPSPSEIIELAEESTFLPMDKLKNGYMIVDLKGKTSEIMKKYTYFAEGDITIAKVRPSFENGNIAIAKNLTSSIGFGTSEIFTIRNLNKDIIQEYLFYFLQNQSFIKYASSTMTGVAGLKRISSSILRETKIMVPNIKKQQEIVSFLNEKTKDIESLIEKKSILIQEYESYKKSLIYEYVTGKKEVGEEEN